MTLLDHQSDIEKHIKRMPSQAELDVLDMSEGARHIVVDPF